MVVAVAKQVTKEEFYNKIGCLDVTVSVVGNYPYKTIFKFRDSIEVGFEKDGIYYLHAEVGGVCR